MAAGLPTADDVLAVVKELITRLGVDAFRTEGRIQLYSGPRRAIALALKGPDDNHARARTQAKRQHLTMIDHTKVGRRIGTFDSSGNIYSYFDRHYGTGSAAGAAHADRVMRETSREFMKAAFGRVATAVCGAATDRIFFEIELPALVENAAIETVNGLPAAMVRDFYRIEPYEAFRLICVAELLEARRYARSVKSPDAARQATQDYRERLTFFGQERRATVSAIAVTRGDDDAQTKLAKKRVLASYRAIAAMAALVDSEPASLEVVPPPRRGLPHSVHAAMPVSGI